MSELVTTFTMQGYSQENAAEFVEYIGRNWKGDKASKVYPKIDGMLTKLLTQSLGTVEMRLPNDVSAAEHAGLQNAIRSVIAETQKAYALHLQVTLASIAGMLDAQDKATEDAVMAKAMSMFDQSLERKVA